MEEESKRPGNSAFKQQKLKACQPVLTPRPVIIIFFSVGALFILIGGLAIAASNGVVEAEERYDDKCALGTACTINLRVGSDMKAPVYFYYRLKWFYQNHRRYVSSRDDQQLRGNLPGSPGAAAACSPFADIGNSTVEPTTRQVYLPCGLVALSTFNDTFVVRPADGGAPLALTSNGIAWKTDVEDKFKNPSDLNAFNEFAPSPPWNPVRNLTDEHFIVWMRNAGLPDFRKLYGISHEDVPAGDYVVDISNNFVVEPFSGRKYVVLSEASWLGGRNPFLGVAYLVIGSLCVAQGILFAVLQVVKPRALGDPALLSWHREGEDEYEDDE